MIPDVIPDVVPDVVGWPEARRLALTRRSLPCGASLLHAPLPDGLVELRAVVPLARGGAAPDAVDRELLRLVLGRSARDVPAAGVAARAADAGGYLLAAVDRGAATLSLHCRPDAALEAAALLAELVAGAAPDPAVLASAGQALRAARAADDLDTAQLDRAVARAVLGAAHPAGTAVPHDVDALEPDLPERLSRALSAFLGPDGTSFLVVGGDPDLADRLELVLADRTAGFTGPVTSLVPRDAFVAGPTLLVEKPGSPQAVIGLAGPAPVDDPAFALAVVLLGGPATSRLSVRLRERRGYAYMAHTQVQRSRIGDIVSSRTLVPAASAAAAVNEVLYEHARAATVVPTDEQVATAARYLAGRVCLSMHAARGAADAVAEALAEGGAPDARAVMAAAVATVTDEQARRAALTHLAPSAMQLVVVADPEVVLPELEAYGSVTRVAAD